MGVEARGNDAAVVEDEKVAGAQMFSEISEGIVAEIAGCTVHDQHAACAALGGRLLRDQFFGQIVVEVGDAQTAVSLFGGTVGIGAGLLRGIRLEMLSAWMRARSMAALSRSRCASIMFEVAFGKVAWESASSETNLRRCA